MPVPQLAQGNFILINTVAPNLPLRLQGAVKTPRIVSQATKHPITEGLSLGNLHVQASLRLALGGEGTILARSTESPLIVAIESGKLRALVIGFDLMDSDLPLRVAFPVLVHNTLEWFQPQQFEFPARSAQSGSPISLPVRTSEGA